jgi:hypothetical protein
VPSFSYSVIVGQVPSPIGVGSMDQNKNVVQVANFGIGEFGRLNL